MKRRRIVISSGLSAGLLLMLACSLSLPTQQPPNVTLTALSVSVAGTATKRAASDLVSSEGLVTAQAEATQRNESLSATQTVYASSHSESAQATQTASAPVVAELPLYLVDLNHGYVAWLHKPVTIEVTGYQQMDYANDYMEITAKDFVLAADITWETQYGSSGCGYMFRSDADQNKPNQYMVMITRYGSGYAAFSALSDGEPANLQLFFPKDQDKKFQWQNKSTNRLAVVARGNQIGIYTNGVLIGEIDTTQPPPPLKMPPSPQKPVNAADLAAMNAYQDQLKEYQQISTQLQGTYQTASVNYATRDAVFSEGFLAMIAASESGKTTCQFSNAWLWMIE